MEILSQQHQQAVVITLVGSMDALTAEQVHSTIGGQLTRGQLQIVLDLSQVDFMSSAGLRVLLDMLKRSRGLGGDLCIAAAQPDIQRVLEISGLVGVMKVHSSVREALDSLGP